MEDGAPHSLKSVTFSPCIFFLKLLKIARMMTRYKSPWTSFLKWGLLWNLCQGYQQELVKNSWSYRLLCRQFSGARRGARAAKRLISLVWHHFLVFLLLNHHFPNEPVRGQYLLMTFPVFCFCCFPWLLPSPPCHCKGEATRLQHVQSFPPPPFAVARRRHLHCTAWFPSLHPSRAVRRPRAKFWHQVTSNPEIRNV